MADSDPLLDALRRLTARPDAEFRHDQREAIEALVNDRSRVLVVQRTGWGKSAVYFLTTHLLRQQGLGPTLLISPLLALMRNQIEAATRLGLRCMTVNSADNTTVHELADALRDDAVDLLVISPERLANPDFANKVMPLVGGRPGLIVIDEVHCISDWGHDFRPDYRRIGRMVDRLAGTQVPILGCTATANDRVVHDVAVQLGAELTTFRGPLRRDGLALAAVPLDRQAERLAWLAETVPTLEGSGIVYCLTVRDVQNVAEWLRSQGIAADGYWGGLDNDDRLAAEQRLKSNETKVLVATTALGMGYDKPDLSFVVHFQSPGSPVAYYQQVGRAGRALERSVGVLLRGLEDEEIQDYFIERAFAQEHLIRDVVAVFERAGEPLSLIRVQTELNVKIGVLELVVKQLDVDGALTRVGPTTYRAVRRTVGLPRRPHRRRHQRPPRRAAVDARLLRHRRLPHAVRRPLARRPVHRRVRHLRQLHGRRGRRATDRRARGRTGRRGRALPARPADRHRAPQDAVRVEHRRPQEDPRQRAHRGGPCAVGVGRRRLGPLGA